MLTQYSVKTLPPFIEQNVSLHDKNWFGTGGAARYFCAPPDARMLQAAVAWAHAHAMPITLLGEGANVLISDDGIDGLVIRLACTSITHAPAHDPHKTLVTAGAGVRMHDLIAWCIEHHFFGLEEFSGIPGTVGGSVFINLHYFEFLLSHFLVSGTVLEIASGQIQRVDAAWFNFGYNQSTLQNRTHILIDATFALTHPDAATAPLMQQFAAGRRLEIIRHRERRYPISGTCGSFFRNFHDNEVDLTINGRKMIFVAYYLDKIGVKGELACGGARVSHQHANMLVNAGSATTADIIILARSMQNLVHERFGIRPHPECELLGFAANPLI